MKKVPTALGVGVAALTLVSLPAAALAAAPTAGNTASDSSAAAVSWALGNGVSKLYKDGTFKPGKDATRLETVTMLQRLSAAGIVDAKSIGGMNLTQLQAAAKGADGKDGVDGKDGKDVIGSTGATGATGAPGPAGAAGPMGATGPAGDDGAPGSVGPQGPQGIQGIQGIQGEKGLPGGTGLVYRTTTAFRAVGNSMPITAPCGAGEVVIGGGYKVLSSDATVVVDRASSPTTWEVGLFLSSDSTVEVTATCIADPNAVP